MAYVTMEATMLICPAEQFLYVLYWLQKLVCWFFLGGEGGAWWGGGGVFLGLQRSPVESCVVELRVKTNPHSCGIKISFPRQVRKV